MSDDDAPRAAIPSHFSQRARISRSVPGYHDPASVLSSVIAVSLFDAIISDFPSACCPTPRHTLLYRNREPYAEKRSANLIYAHTIIFLTLVTAGFSDSRAPLRQLTTSVYLPGTGGSVNTQSIVRVSIYRQQCRYP